MELTKDEIAERVVQLQELEQESQRDCLAEAELDEEIRNLQADETAVRRSPTDAALIRIGLGPNMEVKHMIRMEEGTEVKVSSGERAPLPPLPKRSLH